MEPIFQYKMKVRDYELDAQGIVNNANYQHYYEVTRHEFLESCGVSFMEVHNQGIDPIVSSITIKYKNSLVGSDEFICTINLEKKGIRYYFNQQIIRLSDKALCSEARVEVVCLINGKVGRPDLFDQILEKYL
ncbi:acyl-CoA thioesterase [Dysgonomonas sp. HDW5A]|uniref:acyl-CoA thioesterase n=1 Tax=unclassified Dysgonomonas TaxID=2630389 RepID=UPI00140D8D22|nr:MULTISPECIES: acyl-CoA thioesterase [unclassified Dysgonomonas]QIK55817.1 acyl-CoA thioesterase [Dysgonomonas sp. HDW5B]QIK61213.1 acyl-CoA thioesterase [Dysgonomonas sp. HDW5A]